MDSLLSNLVLLLFVPLLHALQPDSLGLVVAFYHCSPHVANHLSAMGPLPSSQCSCTGPGAHIHKRSSVVAIGTVLLATIVVVAVLGILEVMLGIPVVRITPCVFNAVILLVVLVLRHEGSRISWQRIVLQNYENNRSGQYNKRSDQDLVNHQYLCDDKACYFYRSHVDR